MSMEMKKVRISTRYRGIWFEIEHKQLVKSVTTSKPFISPSKTSNNTDENETAEEDEIVVKKEVVKKPFVAPTKSFVSPMKSSAVAPKKAQGKAAAPAAVVETAESTEAPGGIYWKVHLLILYTWFFEEWFQKSVILWEQLK